MRIFGAIERKDAEMISGWLAILPSERAHTVLEIVIDGRVIGRVEAKAARRDVKDAGFGSGEYGFSFRFPADIEPAQAAAAQVRPQGTELYLTKAQPVTSAATPEAAPAGTGGVFILGPARSGTSVTFLALRKVLRIPGLGEGHVLPIFQRMLFSYREYAREFAGQDGVLASRLDAAALEESLIGTIRRFYADQFLNGRFVDKTPGLEALTGAPFVKKVFPGAKLIVTSRNGIEVVESYRRKFKSSFVEACLQWAGCAKQIALLRTTMPEALFLDQNEMRASPDAVARAIADHVGQPDKAEALADFFRESREDIHSDKGSWDAPPTLETVGWTEEEKGIYLERCGVG